MEKLITLFVKENGIAKIILEMKREMEYQDYIDKFDNNWQIISSHELSFDFIRLYKDHINWYYVQMNVKFTDEELIEFEDYIEWEEFCPSLGNTPEIIERYVEKINWAFVFHRLDCITDEMVIYFKDNLQPYVRLHFIHGIPVEYVNRFRELTIN